MKKTFALRDLDCANCALKMETAIAKLEGVHEVSINFFTQKMVLDAEDDRFETVVKEAVRVCKKVEPDCRILG